MAPKAIGSRQNPKKVAYRISLRNARGFSSLRAAKFFRIFYGKRPVTVWVEFPKRAKKVSQKRKILLQLLEDIETRIHQEIIARRLKAKLAREEVKRKAEEKKLKARARRELAKRKILEKKKVVVEEEIAEEKEKVISLLDRERLDVKRRRVEESQIRPKAVLAPVVITPIITGTKDYKKEILLKKVRSETYGVIDLKILNYTLTKNIYMDSSNVEEVKNRLIGKFWPHLVKFFTESAGTKGRYIFRLKYDMVNADKTLSHQGIGASRFEITSLKDLGNFEFELQKVFELLQSKNMETYLFKALGKSIEITGFTIENIIKAKSDLLRTIRK